MIKMGFFGSYKTDIYHYFSRILKVLDKRVAIVDASNDSYLYHSIPQLEEEFVTYRDVDIYITKDGLEAATTGDYDVLIIDYGFNSLDNDFQACEIKLLVTDLQKHNISRVKDVLDSTSNKPQIIRIYRDLVGGKINPRYIDNYLNLEEKAEVIAEYDFYLDEDAYKCNIQCQYDDIISFKKLPKEYKSMFKELLGQYFSLDNKSITKAIKQAEGGK